MKFSLKIFLTASLLNLSFGVSAQSLAEEKARADRKAQVQNQMRIDNEAKAQQLQTTLKTYAFRIKCSLLDGGHYAFLQGVVYQDALETGNSPDYSAQARYKIANGVATWVNGGYYEYHFATSTLYRKVTTKVYEDRCAVVNAVTNYL